MTFSEFYKSVTGHKPYHWQVELSECLARGEWHDLLTLPTGTGKTSLIEIWYYNLVTQMASDMRRTTPMRCYWIINRRTVVDDVFHRAAKLKEIVKNLGLFSKDQQLEVFRLRGGMGEKEGNLSLNPSAPALYVSTLDSYGSRVLFRSYNCGPNYRAVHAGLAFFDSLVVLDEAHLAKPLLALLERTKQIQGAAKTGLPGVLLPRVISVSATPGDGDKFPIKNLSDLRHRIDCRKSIKLIEVKGSALPRKVKSLVNDAMTKHKAISVVCNTVNTARQVFKEIKSIKGIESYLLIGSNRPHDNDSDEMRGLYEYLKCRKERKESDKPKVVVSTQTIEIAVDYDFDHMISEIAALPSMIQRAGRLMRDGSKDGAEFICLYGMNNPIYGEAADWCLEFLQQLNEEELRFPLPKPNRNMSLPSERIINLTDDDVERLVITNPDLPFDVDPYIKGVKEYDSDVFVAWRDWVDLRNRTAEDRTIETLKITGTKPAEMVRVSLFSVWYNTIHSADFTFAITEKNTDKSRLYSKKCVIRRYGKYSVKGIKDARPGDTIILPSSYGGLDKWGWNLDETSPAEDVFNDIKMGKVYFHGKSEHITFDDLKEEIVKLGRESDKFSGIVPPRPDRKAVPMGVVVRPKGLYDNRNREAISSLEVHTKLVVHFVRKFLMKLRLHRFLDHFTIAAEYHDLGKADRRFQHYMYGNNIINPDHLMAKPVTTAGTYVSPRGWRHELASLQILHDSNVYDSIPLLTRHLIGSHHGWWRPYARVLVDNLHQPREFNLCDRKWVSKNPFSGFANKSWQEFNQKYGPWGLAFLEAIFRLADGTASSYKGKLPSCCRQVDASKCSCRRARKGSRKS